MLRSTVAALVLASASILPLAAHADTLDVMTVSGNGHTWTFDFPSVQTFTYQTNLNLFVPGLLPLSATLDGASITPTDIYFHNSQNLTGPFGQIITPADLLFILSSTGPYTYPGNPFESYYAYTSTLLTGNYFGIGFVPSANGGSGVPFTITVDAEQSAAPTPEPSSLVLLGTGILGFAGLIRRRLA